MKMETLLYICSVENNAKLSISQSSQRLYLLKLLRSLGLSVAQLDQVTHAILFHISHMH